MEQRRLKGAKVAILVTQDFEQVEMTEPRKALEYEWADTILIAPEPGEVQGMRHDEKADLFPVELTLAEADPSEFDALLLPGGALNADELRVDPRARAFAREMDRAGKPIAAICHAPWLLVSAGLVRGRTLTSYHTLQDDIRCAGGSWVDREVARDGNWVTSRQPKDIAAFNKAMIGLFGEPRVAREQDPGAARAR
ncbi:MAG: protease [Chloroflexi bacterium 13_1_40CM_4_68_4]|nr:MAG: protease [Chloroflexi bacterium 13_1_40CM_4_68_4]